MKQELYQQAMIGEKKDPWKLLLQVGAETLRDQAGSVPQPSSQNEVYYSRPDNLETLTEQQASSVLDFGYIRLGIELHKRVPLTCLGQYLKGAFWPRDYMNDEEAATLFGNAGLFLISLCYGDGWRGDELSKIYPASFIYDRCFEPELALRLAERDFLDEKRTTFARADALKLVRKLDPAKGRDLFEKFVDGKIDVGAKGSEYRFLFYTAMWTNISDDDVPVLEKVARGKTFLFAQIAYQQLSTLPGSSYYATIRRRADELFDENGRLTPPAVTKELKSEKFLPIKGDYVVAVLERVPLEYWEQRFSKTPEEIGKLIPLSKETYKIYLGWLLAYKNYGGAADWVKTLSPLELEETDRRKNPELSDYYDAYSGGKRVANFSPSVLLSNRIKALFPDIFKEISIRKLERSYRKSPEKLKFYSFIAKWDAAPTPRSRELCQEFFDLVFGEIEKPNVEFQRELITEYDMFPVDYREKIRDKIREIPATTPGQKGAFKLSEELYEKVEEAERLFGDFRKNFQKKDPDQPIKRFVHWIS